MRFSPCGYVLAFCFAYCLVLAFELPVPSYYPLTGVWSFTDLSGIEGTAMHWYGLTLAALMVGAVSAYVLPGRRLPSLIVNNSIAVVWVSMAIVAYLMRGYFGFAVL